MAQDNALVKIREQLDKHSTSKPDILSALDLLPESRVLLIGDFIVDLYTYCEALGKTSKTPTLSVRRGPTERFWGGSGLLATNLLGLGAAVNFVTVCGNDCGRDFLAQRQHEDLDLHLIVDDTRPTTLKERFWVDGYNLLQVDTVENKDICARIQHEVKAHVRDQIDQCDFVLVSDFRHGLMTADLISFLKSVCADQHKTLIADTQVSNRPGNVAEYGGVDLICANELEARDWLRDEHCDRWSTVERLYELLRVRRLVVKLGAAGLVGCDQGGQHFHLPAIPAEVKDAVGAGDAFLAAAALTYRPDVKLITPPSPGPTRGGQLPSPPLPPAPRAGVRGQSVHKHIEVGSVRTPRPGPSASSELVRRRSEHGTRRTWAGSLLGPPNTEAGSVPPDDAGAGPAASFQPAPLPSPWQTANRPGRQPPFQANHAPTLGLTHRGSASASRKRP